MRRCSHDLALAFVTPEAVSESKLRYPPRDEGVEMRLAAARRLLRESGALLREIAERTEFAAVNHVCEALRRTFHLSYRRQVN